MIAEHQPPHFPDNIVGAVSSAADGSLRYPPGNAEAARRMSNWLAKQGIDPNDAAGMLIKYDKDRSYTDIKELHQVPGGGILSEDGWVEVDALVTNKPNIALVLPTGDCNSPQFVDPRNEVIALGHAGWHSTIHNLLSKIVAHLQENHNTDPGELLVHFPPSIRRGSYIFDNLTEVGELGHNGRPQWHSPAYATRRSDGRYDIDLMAYNLDLLHYAGVRPENIEVAQADTFKNKNYFSNHRRHYEPESPRSMGRIATVIMMKS